MRARLARKVLKYRGRYNRGKIENAMRRLGWVAISWRVQVRIKS